jgi:hypothetical protein
MKGPVFDPGLPIPLTIRSLESVQGLLDRSYLVLSHKQRISAQERSLFFLRSQGIEHGSLFATLGLVFTAAQPVLPIVSDLGPSGVWEHAKQAFEFLKIIFEAKKQGASVDITQTGDGLINVNTGSQTFVFNSPVYYIANNSLPHYEFLSKQLAPERVTDIRIGEGRRRDIALGLPERELFELPSIVEEKQHSVRGEIFEFDKYEGTGRLNVEDGQSIPKGEYRFTVIGKQELSDYIEAMLHREVSVTCLEETVDHPLVGRKILSLHVLNVKR